jgi:hypothetical protein
LVVLLSAVVFIVVVLFDCFTNIRQGFSIYKKNLIYFFYKVGWSIHSKHSIMCQPFIPLIL